MHFSSSIPHLTLFTLDLFFFFLSLSLFSLSLAFERLSSVATSRQCRNDVLIRVAFMLFCFLIFFIICHRHFFSSLVQPCYSFSSSLYFYVLSDWSQYLFYLPRIISFFELFLSSIIQAPTIHPYAHELEAFSSLYSSKHTKSRWCIGLRKQLSPHVIQFM